MQCEFLILIEPKSNSKLIWLNFWDNSIKSNVTSLSLISSKWHPPHPAALWSSSSSSSSSLTLIHLNTKSWIFPHQKSFQGISFFIKSRRRRWSNSLETCHFNVIQMTWKSHRVNFVKVVRGHMTWNCNVREGQIPVALIRPKYAQRGEGCVGSKFNGTEAHVTSLTATLISTGQPTRKKRLIVPSSSNVIEMSSKWRQSDTWIT